MNDIKNKNFLEIQKANKKLIAESMKFNEQFQLLNIEHFKLKYDAKNLPDLCYRNKDFLVQEYHESEHVVRLSICRTRLNKLGEWQDDISWDELQNIKNKIGYAEFDAIEIFPKEKDVVNVSNMRHLWITPDPIAFAWRNKTKILKIN